MDIKKFFRKDINNFKFWPLIPSFIEGDQYKSGYLKIDQGENVFDIPEDILKKISKLKLQYYPGVSDELINLIKDKNNIQDKVFLGNGSLELLDLISRLFLEQEDELLVTSPTYPLYSYFAQLRKAKTVLAQRKDYQVITAEDFKNKITSKTKLIILDNPSNPFGSETSLDEIRKILDLGIITILDEAYYGYTDITASGLVKDYPNLIVLRTFSKMFGMAGARLAYAITNQDIFEAMVKIKVPHQVNIFSQFVAKEMLKSDILAERSKTLLEGREYLLEELNKLDFLEVYDSKGAYIVFKPIDKISSVDLLNKLSENKILIKLMDFPDLPAGYVRLNVVPKSYGENIIKLLSEI